MESRGWWVVSWMIDEVPTNAYEAAVSKIEGMKTRTELDNNGIRAIYGLVFRGPHHDSVMAEFRSVIVWPLVGTRSNYASTPNHAAKRQPGEEIFSRFRGAFADASTTSSPDGRRARRDAHSWRRSRRTTTYTNGSNRHGPNRSLSGTYASAFSSYCTNRLGRKSMPIWQRSMIYLRNLSSPR